MVAMLLEAVEAQYIYAVSVNDDRHFKEVCIHRGTQGGTDQGERGINCNMIEQEIQAISTLTSLCSESVVSVGNDFVELFESSFFRYVMDIYLNFSPDSHTDPLLKQITSRACILACARYTQMEHSLSGASDMIASKLLVSYVSVIEGMLNTILEFPDHQFRRHQKWVISILPDLIISRELTVRKIVSSIYIKHINPRIAT
jgi:hypothetical protein